MESTIRGLVLDSSVLVAAERAKLTTPEVLRNIRASADIRQNDIDWPRQNVQQGCEVCALRREGVRTEVERVQASFRFRQFDRIDIETGQMAIWLNRFEKRAGMTAITQRAIRHHVAGLRPENLQDFANHYWPMHTGGSAPARDYLRDIAGISLGRKFLVLLRKTSRVLALVARPAFRFLGIHIHQSLNLKESPNLGKFLSISYTSRDSRTHPGITARSRRVAGCVLVIPNNAPVYPGAQGESLCSGSVIVVFGG
jgi:hypothetical protein